jgi:transposase-like protein
MGDLDPRTIHGQLIEAIHLSGYSFQRAWAEFKYLLEDQRWKKCGFKNINEFVASIPFGDFRISIEERQEAARVCVESGASQRSTAKALGVDETTVRRDLRDGAANAAAGAEEPKENQPDENDSAANAAPRSKAAATRTAHERIAKKYFTMPAIHVPEGFPLRHGDFYELSSELQDDSVDLIFTDPPYDDESLPLFDKMGEVAARVLKEGGSLVTYLGHMQLLEAGRILSRHLRFWHPLACLHAGPFARMTEFGVIENWKPMLWFVRGTRADKHTFVESVFGAREKDTHPWQQSESEAEYFINALSPPDGMVVDFFAGGGTTIVAAERLGRNVIGYEISESHFRKAVDRIAESSREAAE